jgi:Flp pilus assembly pilin Flp
MRSALKRLLVDEEGQDIVEYALLVAFVGLAVLAAWIAIQNAVANGYLNWDAQEQIVSAGPGGDPNGPLTTPNPQ